MKAVKAIESPRHYQRPVQEIMSTPVATVQDTDTYKHIVEVLHPIKHHRQQAKVDKVFAGQLMTSPAITVTADTPVAQAARTMQKAGVKRLVVVNAEGRPFGIVSRGDVLKIFLRKDAEIHSEVIEGVMTQDMMIDTGGIEVRVDDGVVTLTGEVERASDIGRLERLIFAVDGVVDVRSSLGFRLDDTVVDAMAGPAGPIAGLR